MPKEQWNCEKCGCSCPTQKSAFECEARHVGIVRIVEVRYEQHDRGKGLYPFELIAEMTDGSTSRFVRM